MKRNIELENIEKDALKILSEAECITIPCGQCPLNYRMNDISFCIKCVCQTLLEKYNNSTH